MNFLFYAKQQVAVGGEGPVTGRGPGLGLVGGGAQLAHAGDEYIADEGGLLRQVVELSLIHI